MILILSILFILFQIIFALNKSVFWHISDFHLNDVYYKQANCYQDHPFANYRCDSSLKLIQSSLAFLKDKTKKEKPDFIVMTGDNGPHLDNLDKSSTLKIIDLVTKEYEKYLDPSIPFIPIVGNHDVFPANEMDADPKSKLSALSWCTELKMKWSKYINESGPLPKSDFSKGCYYSRYIKQGDLQLIITSLNGLVWYYNNKYAEPGVDDTIDTYDPLGQFAWLKSIFKWARKNKAKVINTNHFPLGATINSPQLYRNMWPLANEKLIKLYREYSDVISAHLVAHEHVDSFRVLLDESNQKAVGMFLLAPSIDPFEFKNFGAFNPRMRKFIYDNTTGQILNYQQYVLDISSAEKIEEGWKEDYEFLSAYDQTELTPNSLLDIVNSFEDDFDYRNHWSFYWDSELGHTKRKGDCAEVPKMLTKCRCEHICAFKFLTYPELNNCLSLCPSNSNLRKIIFMVFGVGVILVGMVVIILINKRRKKDQLEIPILDDEQNINI